MTQKKSEKAKKPPLKKVRTKNSIALNWPEEEGSADVEEVKREYKNRVVVPVSDHVYLPSEARDESMDPDMSADELDKVVTFRRGLKESDKAYIIDTWGRGLRGGVRAFRRIGWKHFWFMFRNRVYDLLDENDFLILHPANDEDMIMGWVSWKGDCIFYIYVAHSYRGFGLGRKLWNEIRKDIKTRAISTKGIPPWIREATEVRLQRMLSSQYRKPRILRIRDGEETEAVVFGGVPNASYVGGKVL